MTGLQSCRRCSHTYVAKPHACPPRFVVWCPDYGETEEDGRAFHAHSAEDAAEAWAEWSDRTSADYTIAGGSTVTVQVRREDDGSTEEVCISGETDVRYVASAVHP